MELTDLASVVPVDFAWSDIGSWQEIWTRSPKDAASNVAVGDVILQDTAGSLVYGGSDGLTVVTGLEDVVVVNTDDVVRSEEHTSELQSLMRISYAVFCLKKKKQEINTQF